jgi:hypothetical protein
MSLSPSSLSSQQPPPRHQKQLRASASAWAGAVVEGKGRGNNNNNNSNGLSPQPPPADIALTLHGEGSGSSFPDLSHGGRSARRRGGEESETTIRPSSSSTAAASPRYRRDSSSSSTSIHNPRKSILEQQKQQQEHEQDAVAGVSTQTHLLQLPPNHLHRLPPTPPRQPSDLADEHPTITTTTTEHTPQQNTTSPNSSSRFAAFATPLVRHARSLSNTSSSSTSSLLANMFKPASAAAPEPAPAKKGFFGALLHPSSRSSTDFRPAPPTQTTDVIDEFAGISFVAVMRSFLQEQDTQSDDAEHHPAEKRTPEARLEDAVTTATDLLDRVYTAYLARTSLVRDFVGEADAQREDLEAQQTVAASLRVQLDRLATNEKEARDEQERRLEEQAQRIAQLETELRRREAVDEARRNRCKRTSAASDSGFESDVDSIYTASRASTVVSPTLMMEEEDEACQDCESCRRHSTAPAIPTPLREAWCPDATTPTQQLPQQPKAPVKQGVWGFFKKNQQPVDNRDINTVRMENRFLREQVREMEKAIDGALEAVVGRGIDL